jgi:HAD superfamily hydrolase (TIGR01509 family)
MAESVELVIFDCDGILVDTERLAISIDEQVLADAGWPMTKEEIVERFVGRSDAYMLAEVERRTGRDLTSEWYTTYAKMYRTLFEAELRPVPGIVEVLDALDIETCVASSGTRERIQFTLGITGLLDRFDGHIYSAEDVDRGKPFPDLFLHAADAMDTSPNACVVVEDSAAGVEAARSASMRVLAYGAGVTPPQKLAGAATTVFDNMAQLPELIARL